MAMASPALSAACQVRWVRTLPFRLATMYAVCVAVGGVFGWAGACASHSSARRRSLPRSRKLLSWSARVHSPLRIVYLLCSSRQPRSSASASVS
ncbi:MAG TPA: hypothetical protein VFE59_01775 [Trebonia sp.]|nr:hypothetical protein [Trebonia sp.]